MNFFKFLFIRLCWAVAAIWPAYERRLSRLTAAEIVKALPQTRAATVRACRPDEFDAVAMAAAVIEEACRHGVTPAGRAEITQEVRWHLRHLE